MLQLKKSFHTLVLPLVFKRLEVVLAKNCAPSFKKQLDRFYKPTAINTIVFFVIVMIVFPETKARFKESL